MWVWGGVCMCLQRQHNLKESRYVHAHIYKPTSTIVGRQQEKKTEQSVILSFHATPHAHTHTKVTNVFSVGKRSHTENFST